MIQKSLIIGLYDVSDTALVSVDSVETSTSVTYAVIKEITIKANISSSKFRVKHEMKGRTATGYSRVYLNGEAVGDERTDGTDTYAAYTDDLSNIIYGDKIQLYVKATGDGVDVKNFRLCGVETVGVETA